MTHLVVCVVCLLLLTFKVDICSVYDVSGDDTEEHIDICHLLVNGGKVDSSTAVIAKL
jgi:hypothetical protein